MGQGSGNFTLHLTHVISVLNVFNGTLERVLQSLSTCVFPALRVFDNERSPGTHPKCVSVCLVSFLFSWLIDSGFKAFI